MESTDLEKAQKMISDGGLVNKQFEDSLKKYSGGICDSTPSCLNEHASALKEYDSWLSSNLLKQTKLINLCKELRSSLGF